MQGLWLSANPPGLVAFPGEVLFFPWSPGQRVAGNQVCPRGAGVQLKGKRLGHSTKYGFTSGPHIGPSTGHQELEFPVLPPPPLPAPPVCLSSRPSCHSLLLCSVSFKENSCRSQGDGQTLRPSLAHSILTAVLDRAGRPRGLCQSHPQPEKEVMPGPSKTGQGRPRWALGGVSSASAHRHLAVNPVLESEPGQGRVAQQDAGSHASPISQASLRCKLDGTQR